MASTEGYTCGICSETIQDIFETCSESAHNICETCWTKMISDIVAKSQAVELLTEPLCVFCGRPIDVAKLPETVKHRVQTILSTIPNTATPQTVEDFGYFFDEFGVLRHKETKEKFIYLTNRHYNLLGGCVEKYIQSLMKSEKWNYKEVWLPIRDTESDDHHDQVNIFVSDDFQTNENGCLILIQGSGVVRPGQWARSCCINESLDIGAMFPYMAKAIENKLSVIILNPNQTSYVDTKSPEENDDAENEQTDDLRSFYLSPKPLPRPKMRKILELSTSREHVLYVYENIIKKMCPAKKFYIVAHSAGGDSLMYLLRKRKDDILPKLSNIAFTDSVHSLSPVEPEEIVTFLKNNAIHFVASDEPMGTPVDNRYYFSESNACPEVSAGHYKHEYTSGFSVQGVFDFFFPRTSPIDEEMSSQRSEIF